jgi:hypothetical protein
MTPVSATRARSRAGEMTLRISFLAVAALSALGLFLVAPGSAKAAVVGGAPITVTWANDSSSASAYQPARSTSSVHYSSLKNISVTVDQTKGIQDQAVGVTIDHFAATRSGSESSGATWTDAMNFMQAMQCWGDPNAADFNQTCEWGGNYNTPILNTVYPDNMQRVANSDIAAGANRPDPDPNDVPFKAVDGTIVPGHEVAGKDSAGNPITTYPLQEFFNTSTTNEVQSVRLDSTGHASFDFETQNSDNAPQLGCGTAGHLRCWLVLVPRDDVYGGHDATCSTIFGSSFEPYVYGQKNAVQAGSPINPACDYWQNRMVVPLDFTPTGNTCAQGNTERRLIGSELLIGAMASWQPQLCTDLSTTFSFSTNPDSVARSQLIENQAGLAFGSYPVTNADLSTDDQATLVQTQLSYAPVAVTSAVFAYRAEGPNGQIDSLNLSPRLVAKLLTQSYEFTVPGNSQEPTANYAHLGEVNRKYIYWRQDPDFQALNPNWEQFAENPAIVLPGPSSADVIAQLWKWIDADAQARAWLGGAPDPWGMTINPYYLPAGDPNAHVPTFSNVGGFAVADPDDSPVGLKNLDGTPLKIADVPQNSFIKADTSLVPIVLPAIVRYPFGSLQFAPYADDFATAARSTFRADPGSKTSWNPNTVDSSGQVGAWVSGGAQIPGQRFTISFTDAASAQRYDLDTAALQIDNAPSQLVAPSDDTLNSALATALSATSDPSVSQVDPTKTGAGAYPLTTVVYATVNLSGTDAAARTDFSHFIKQVTTKGQQPGVGVGQLPPGYVPLTSGLATQAAGAATAIASYVQSTDDSSGSDYPQDDYVPASSPVGTSTGAPTKPGGAVATSQKSSVKRTPKSPVPPIGQGALVLSLGGGVAGSVFSPWLFRRRRFV